MLFRSAELHKYFPQPLDCDFLSVSTDADRIVLAEDASKAASAEKDSPGPPFTADARLLPHMNPRAGKLGEDARPAGSCLGPAVRAAFSGT